MSSKTDDEQSLEPHHEQQELCTTRLPYRQGRKLTAVKVYTVNNESNHLLIFGIPSLNLRQEAKLLFSKFGKLLQFNLTKLTSEQFTETYHASYEKIQSARIAKKMLDTKNFYGGSLHVCYAPEYETLDETRRKLMQRQRDVILRLKNLSKEEKAKEIELKEKLDLIIEKPEKEKLNMGDVNIIKTNEREFKTKKRKMNTEVILEKRFKPCFLPKNEVPTTSKSTVDIVRNKYEMGENSRNEDSMVENSRNKDDTVEIEVIDCTSVETETITNINENLNYNNFGNEIVRKIPEKPVNKIRFNLNKNSLIYF